MGRITRKSASGRTLLAYGYDLNGNLTTQCDVTGKVTEYTYNALDLIEKVTDNGTVAAEYSYYPDGSIRSLKNGNLYTEYAFDADKNLTGLKTMLGTEVLADNHYTYDLNGNRTEKRQINGTTRYTYDTLNQLNKVQYPSYTEELYYDRAGNRTRRIAKGVEELYKYDPRNRLTEYTKGGVTTQFTYDNAGNLLKDDKARYTYDAFNRTEKVETFDGHVQINRYDAEGLRHEMEEDGRLVQFIFRGDEVVAEEKDNSIIRYIRGYDLIASDAERARTYYHYASDEMSSITHMVEGTDVRNHYEYDAWGNTTVCEETVENRFHFNGQQYDPITQQYYLRARFYNPVIARFTQEDTYRGDGLNLYTYCANNPVYYEDPSGHMPACMKAVYDKALAENKSKAEAYRLAKQAYWEGQARARQEAEQRALQEMNILHKPISDWTDAELQRAVDSIHNAQFNGSWFGNLSPMAVTVDQGGRVVVTKNGGPVRADSPAGQMAIKIFGPDVEFPSGRGSNYPKINGDPDNRHAEARGIQAFIHGDTNIVFGKDEVRQACSHYSCGSTNLNQGCAGKITQHNVTPITDFAQMHNGKIGRPYVSNLWYL